MVEKYRKILLSLGMETGRLLHCISILQFHCPSVGRRPFALYLPVGVVESQGPFPLQL